MIVQLILAAGSRAGTVANIHPGYYLIGRHRECQIRPKSRSVSRYHCIVHHSPDQLLVYDLDSTSGTRINNVRIAPRQWTRLQSDDELRAGKVAFSVLIHEAQSDAPQAVGALSGEQDSSASMVRGAALQEADIADFLEAADDAERQQRYESIRGRMSKQNARDEDDDIHFEDTPLESDEVTSAGDSGVALDDDDREHGKGPRHANQRSSPGRLPPHLKKKLASKSKGGSGFDVERWKLIAASIFAALVISFAVYSFFQFQGGSQPRVIEGID